MTALGLGCVETSENRSNCDLVLFVEFFFGGNEISYLTGSNVQKSGKFAPTTESNDVFTPPRS